MSLRWLLTLIGLLTIAAGSWSASVDTPAALEAAKRCREQSDPSACRRAIRLGLSPKLASEAYTFWADSSPNQFGDTTAPEKLLRTAIKLDPQNALATYLLANSLPRSNYKQAEEQNRLYRKAAELRPDWDGAQAHLGNWQRAMELAPDDAAYRSRYEEEKKQREVAAAKLQEAEEEAKRDPKTSASVIWAAKRACDLRKAEQYAQIATRQLAPGDWPSTPARLLADAFETCGQYEKARELYRKVIADFERRLDSGLTQNEVIQVPEQDLQFLYLLPELVRFYQVEATLAERSGQWGFAQVSLERASHIAPTATMYARLAADTLKARGQSDYWGIRNALEKGLKLDPKLMERYPELKPYAPPEQKKK